MHFTEFGKMFVLYSLAAAAVCTLIALAAQVAGRGKLGLFGKIITVLAAIAGSFYALHWDKFGKFTREEWLRKSAPASTIVQAFIISLFSMGFADMIYKRIRRK